MAMMVRGAILFHLDILKSLRNVAKFDQGEFLFLNRIPNFSNVNFSSTTLDSESFIGYFFVPTAVVSNLNLTTF